MGICYNSGQDCTAGSRVYVQNSIYDKFIALLTDRVKDVALGDGFDAKSSAGPVVRLHSRASSAAGFHLLRKSDMYNRFPRRSTIVFGAISNQVKLKVQTLLLVERNEVGKGIGLTPQVG